MARRRTPRRSRSARPAAPSQRTAPSRDPAASSGIRSRRRPARPDKPSDRRRDAKKHDQLLVVGIAGVGLLIVLAIVAIVALNSSNADPATRSPVTTASTGPATRPVRPLPPLTIDQGTIRQGMTQSQIQAMLGKPVVTSSATHDRYGTETTWEYGGASFLGASESDSLRINFDRNGRVYRYSNGGGSSVAN